MIASTAYSKHYTDGYNLPPMTVKKRVKKKDSWKRAVMDGFERIAVDQFMENLEFTDLYRMIEGKLTYQELSEVAPHFDDIESVLDGVGIPTFLRHYDIVGTILKGLTGILIQMQDKYHVTDTGEIAMNEFLRQQGKQLSKMLESVLENSIQLSLAEAGYDKDLNQFKSEEEKQSYMQELSKAREKFTPKDTLQASKKKFKTIGVKWGEATFEHDNQRFDMKYLNKEDFKHYFTTGKCFRHFRIGFDSYEPETWSAKNTFYSKEVDAKLVHKGEYVGNLGFKTPAQVIKLYGHLIDSKTQKELLGGNESWGQFALDEGFSGDITNALKSNFNKQVRTPFSGYYDYNFYLGLQEETGIPLGVQTLFEEDGSTTTRERFLPKLAGNARSSAYEGYANILRDDYKHRTDLCQVTEAYFRAYEHIGYLTYEDEYGAVVTEEVDEDILPEFLKENNISKTYKESLVDIIKDFEVDTLKWTLRPVIYYGVKVVSGNLAEPLYLKCEEYEHQIKGDSEFDRWLPVAGFIGESRAKLIEPYQAKHNLCMNQVYNLLEKELGVFFLMDVGMIPSEFDGWGDAQEALMAVRNIAKDTGIMPTAISQDGNGANSLHNQFATYNLSNSAQISDRIRIAEMTKSNAYEVIGLSRAAMQQPTKYETAEGIRQNQEAGWAQLAETYEDFNLFLKAANELHLSVAQYCQSNKKDNSLYYTKSDGSIEFLKIQDPDFPLRRLGIIATSDSSKRKELETYKSILMNNNTLGNDTLELAKLISSDGMAEAVEIARLAQERQRSREDQQQSQQGQMQQQQLQAKAQESEKAWTREEASKEKDRQAKIQVAKINALGRASDKESDTYGIEQIKLAANKAITTNKIDSEREIALDKNRIQEKKDTAETANKMETLKLKAKELAEKTAKRKSDEYIATINKN